MTVLVTLRGGRLPGGKVLDGPRFEGRRFPPALLRCEALGLERAEFCHIQSWLKGETIPERSAQRIFHVADEILRAGRPSDASE